MRVKVLEAALWIPSEGLLSDRHVPKLGGHLVEVALLGQRRRVVRRRFWGGSLLFHDGFAVFQGRSQAGIDLGEV